MKILVDSIGTAPAGTEKSMIEFLKFLVGEGHDVYLHLWQKPGLLYNQIHKKVIIIDKELYPGAFKKCFGLKNLLWYVVFRFFALLHIPTKCFKRIRGKFDLAIAYCNYGYSPYYVIDKVTADRKILFYHHGVYENYGLKKISDKYYYSRFETIIPVSRAVDNALKASLGKHLKTVVINNLIDADAILRQSQELCDLPYSKNHIFLTIGRLTEEKNQIFAIEVASVLKKRGVDFVWLFIGDGSQKCNLIEMTSRMGLGDNCFFLGAKANPYPYMASCSLYVQPSLYEAAPVTIREAMILSRKIVASDIPSMRESLMNYNNASLVELDVDCFADKIYELLYVDNSDDSPKKFPDINKENIIKLRNVIYRN